MSKKILLYTMAVISMAMVAAAPPAQHHPFSQLYPPDSDLNFGGQNIDNLGQLQVTTIRPDGSDITFEANDGISSLVWDDSADQWIVQNSNLAMGSNNILSSGLIDGVDLDNPGNAIIVDGSNRIAVGSNTIGNAELNNADSFTVGGLTSNGAINANGNRITNVVSTSAGDAVNKSWASSNDDTIPDDQTLSEVLAQGNSAGTYNINMSGNAITNIDWSTSDDGSSSGLDADLLDGNTGSYYLDNTDSQNLNNVLSQGNSAGGRNIHNIGNGYIDMVDDTGQNRFELRSGGSYDICIGAC